MNPAALIEVLRTYDAVLRENGATGLFIFGSRAGGVPRPDSDLDLFIDYDPEAKVPNMIADQFQTQEGRRLLILFEKGVSAVGPEDLLAVIDPFHHVLQFAPDSPGILFAKESDHPVGGRLELGGIGDRDKPIVLFDEFDSLAGEFALDKIVAVEVGGNGEGKKGADAQDHRSGDRVHDVKIEMGVEGAHLAHDLVVGIGAGVLGFENAKGPALLLAFDNVINPELARLQAAVLAGSDPVLIAHVILGPLPEAPDDCGQNGPPRFYNPGCVGGPVPW